MFKRITIALARAVAVTMLVAAPAFAVDLAAKNWKVYDRNADAAAHGRTWDIDKATILDGGGIGFTFQPFTSPTTGWFTAYLITNYSGDLTGTTLTATVTAAVTPGTQFFTRGSGDARVRLELQTTKGPYSPNDYWWSTGGANSLTLAGLALNGTGTLSVSTLDRSRWSNIAGKLASDTTAPWVNYDGTIQMVSPYDGFTAALADVKMLGLGFGNPSMYASGVAVSGGGGAFELRSFVIE